MVKKGLQARSGYYLPQAVDRRRQIDTPIRYAISGPTENNDWDVGYLVDIEGGGYPVVQLMGYSDTDELLAMSYNEAADLARDLNRRFPELLKGKRHIFRPIPLDEADPFIQYHMMPKEIQDYYCVDGCDFDMPEGWADLNVEENPTYRSSTRIRRWWKGGKEFLVDLRPGGGHFVDGERVSAADFRVEWEFASSNLLPERFEGTEENPYDGDYTRRLRSAAAKKGWRTRKGRHFAATAKKAAKTRKYNRAYKEYLRLLDIYDDEMESRDVRMDAAYKIRALLDRYEFDAL